MVWLEGLANIQLGKVVEFLEPIARGETTDSRHLRFLAAWAALPTAPLRPDVVSLETEFPPRFSIFIVNSLIYRFTRFIGRF